MKASRSIVRSALLLAATAPWAADAQKTPETDAPAQAAIVTALSLVNGYATSGTWVLVQHQRGSNDTHIVSIRTNTARTLPEAASPNSPPTLLARVTSTRRRGAQVEYPAGPVLATGNEEACRAAVAYRAQQGWLPGGFWMKCDRTEDEARVFFMTEPNRWPGDHWSITISKAGLRFIGGR